MGEPARHRPRPGPLHQRFGSGSRGTHRRPRLLPRRARRSGHLAARTEAALQRPQRSNAPPPATLTATTAGPYAATAIAAIDITVHTSPLQLHPAQVPRSCRPVASGSGRSSSASPARLDATRARPHAQRPPPPPGHSATRMVPAWVLHPHRPGYLPAQHADDAAILENRTGPLTTRPCVAIGSDP
jgi:hypothetical protein